MPVISGGSGIWTAVTGGGELISSGQDVLKLVHSGTTTTLEGADATGDDLTIKSNQTDTYPTIKLNGAGDVDHTVSGGLEHNFHSSAGLQVRLSCETNAPHIAIREATSSPANVTNFGQLYTKSDNKLYFKDGDGTEHEVSFV